MTVIALSWNFDNVDISHYCRPPDAPASREAGHLDPVTILDIIFAELSAEADRPIRERLNEALRQWHLRRKPPKSEKPH